MEEGDEMSTEVPEAVPLGLLLSRKAAKSLSVADREQYETLAPCASRSSTMARPMPFVPPVEMGH